MLTRPTTTVAGVDFIVLDAILQVRHHTDTYDLRSFTLGGTMNEPYIILCVGRHPEVIRLLQAQSDFQVEVADDNRQQKGWSDAEAMMAGCCNISALVIANVADEDHHEFLEDIKPHFFGPIVCVDYPDLHHGAMLALGCTHVVDKMAELPNLLRQVRPTGQGPMNQFTVAHHRHRPL